ncbi:MAG: restriction endonuclease subunit S [Pseudoalteromonas distincta]
MGSEWNPTTLGEVLSAGGGTIQTGPFGSQLHASDYVSNGIPVIMPVNIADNRVSTANIARISERDANRLSRHIVREGDIVYSRRGDVTRKALITSAESGMFCGTGCLLVRPGRNIHPRFLTYHLSTPENQEWIIRHAIGATMPNLNTGILAGVPLNVPCLATQESIARILGTLDDKIELNRQMNTTLEAMAQALFKSWFVDFDPVIDNALAAGNEIPEELAARAERRAKAAQQQSPERPHILPAAIRQQFPDRFVFTETMGWVPEGWGAFTLSNAIQINPKVSLRKGHVAKYVDMKALPTSGYGIDEFVWKPYAGGAKFANDDVLLARITPCLENGKTGLVDFLEDNEPGFGSTEFIVMRGKGAISTAYVACLARDTNFRLHCVSSMVGSSGRQRVQNACFDSYFVCVPEDEEVLKLFDARCSPNFEKMTALKNEAVSLASLRDTLLPKLLSGQLRIPEAEQLLAEVI